MLLNDADAVYLGSTRIDAVYLGSRKVWPVVSALDPPQSDAEREPVEDSLRAERRS